LLPARKALVLILLTTKGDREDPNSTQSYAYLQC